MADTDLVGLLLLGVLLGLIPATIAKNKVHEFFGWLFFGTL